MEVLKVFMGTLVVLLFFGIIILLVYQAVTSGKPGNVSVKHENITKVRRNDRRRRRHWPEHDQDFVSNILPLPSKRRGKDGSSDEDDPPDQAA